MITKAVSWRLDTEITEALDRRKTETGLSKTEIVSRALRTHLGLRLDPPGTAGENGAARRPAHAPPATEAIAPKPRGVTKAKARPGAEVQQKADELARAGMPYRTALRIARQQLGG